MPSSLLDTFSRLCVRDNRRTEAEIQADVRQFILDAPFELDEDDLSLVHLESQLTDLPAGVLALRHLHSIPFSSAWLSLNSTARSSKGPIPIFDDRNPIHVRLSQLGAAAEQIAGAFTINFGS
jgi:hypothetical protein